MARNRSADREWYLPESTLSPAGKARGIPAYQLVGALCDTDLFKRLRARAQARGPSGLDDLVTALSLVQGTPFDQPRRGGYGWLSQTPMDDYLTAGIVDIAHIIATDALDRGDVDRAQWAAEAAITVAPTDDRPRLDLAAVLSAQNGSQHGRRYLDDAVFNRSDDGEIPSPCDRVHQIAERSRRLRSWPR